ncbi:MAG: hypothetical protein R3309_04925 [Reinekea sp.]|nr:hypothetical protein [Reinekea sp.]
MTEQTTEQQLEMIGKQAEELEKTPEQAEAEAEQQSQELATIAESEAVAGMMTGVLETVLKLIYPFVEIADDTRQQAQAVLAPLLEKYGVSMGGRWAAELNAVSFFGFAGFGIYQQIQHHKFEQEKAKNGEKREHIAA